MLETRIIQQSDRTLIYAAPEDFPIPRTLLQNGHEPGYLVSGHVIRPWEWHGFTIIEGSRYIACSKMELISLPEVLSLPQNTALNRFETAGRAFAHLAGTEKQIFSGYSAISLLSLFFTSTEELLILPQSLRSYIDSAMDDLQLFESKAQWSCPRLTGEAAAAYELTSWVYAAVTGAGAPAGSRRVRDDDYRSIPAESYRPDLPESWRVWFDRHLSMKTAGDISLASWYESFSRLPEISERFSRTTEQQQALDEIIRKQELRSSRKVSLRVHRIRNIVITAVAAAVLLIAGSFIRQALTPPLTAGMSPEEVIVFYFDMYNALDSVSMSDALARGVKSDSEESLSYMFVTSQVRRAYEGDSGFIPAQQWIDEGMPDVPDTSMIYGITDIEISWEDDRTALIDYTQWIPVGVETEGQEREKDAQSIEVTDRFTLEQIKGNWLITDISRVSSR